MQCTAEMTIFRLFKEECDVFLILSVENIDCGYMLEQSPRGRVWIGEGCSGILIIDHFVHYSLSLKHYTYSFKCMCLFFKSVDILITSYQILYLQGCSLSLFSISGHQAWLSNSLILALNIILECPIPSMIFYKLQEWPFHFSFMCVGLCGGIAGVGGVHMCVHAFGDLF